MQHRSNASVYRVAGEAVDQRLAGDTTEIIGWIFDDILVMHQSITQVSVKVVEDIAIIARDQAILCDGDQPSALDEEGGDIRFFVDRIEFGGKYNNEHIKAIQGGCVQDRLAPAALPRCAPVPAGSPPAGCMHPRCCTQHRGYPH